jgi:hypothetical protein
LKNQNPNIPKKLKQPKEGYKTAKDKSYNYMVITILAFFIGLGLSIGFYSYTLISIIELSKFVAIFAVVGFLIPLKFYVKWFSFIKYEVVIFNIIGVAPFFTGLFLLLNLTFSSNAFTHDYKIENIFIEGESHQKSIGVILENNVFSGNKKIIQISHITPELLNSSHFRITLAKGLFGYDVIMEREFIKK